MNTEINELALILLPDVKKYLDITWDDENMDFKILEYLENGIRELRMINPNADFAGNEDGARSLLFKRCLYEKSGKAKEFKDNYREDLMNFAFLYESEEEDGNG